MWKDRLSGRDPEPTSPSVDECLSAADECGAPIVSIAGGEPLMHEDMPQIVAAIVNRKKFVYLCTNGLLLNTA